MKHPPIYRNTAIHISCSTTTSQGNKGLISCLYEKQSFNLAWYKKTQLGLTTPKCASSHISVEAGLHNGKYFFKDWSTFSSLAVMEVLILTRAEVEHTKVMITNTAPLSLKSTCWHWAYKSLRMMAMKFRQKIGLKR